MPLALSEGDVFLIVVFLAMPVAVFAIAGAGKIYEQIGKGVFHLDKEVLPQRGPSEEAAVRRDEVRQLLEAKSFRAQERGEAALDVDAELERLLAEEAPPSRGKLGDDLELREEIRQLVVARNERRKRRGEEPLDIESEIERQLRELESLGQ